MSQKIFKIAATKIIQNSLRCFMQSGVVLVITKTAVNAASMGNFFQKKKKKKKGKNFGKKSYFNAIGSHFRFPQCSEPFESTRFLTFESQLKKSNCLILLLLAI